MRTQQSAFEAVVRRLERVERQNRRLKVIGAAVVLLVGAGVLVGVDGPAPKTVVEEKFIVRDAAGKNWAELAYYEKDGPALLLRDKEGTRTVILGASPSGEAQLQFRDKAGERLILTALPGGAAGIEIKDKTAKQRVSLGVRGERAAVRLRDSKQIDRIYLGTLPAGKAGLSIRDEQATLVFEAPK